MEAFEVGMRGKESGGHADQIRGSGSEEIKTSPQVLLIILY